MEVPQNLNPEQVRYEFPPKSRLQELAQYYDNDDCSFFDESSFTTTSTSTAAYNTSVTEQQDHYDDDNDEEETLMRLNAARRSADYASDHLDRFFHSVSSAWQQDDVMMMMDDEQQQHHRAASMSPLHLPQQQQQQHRPREESCDSTDTVKQCRAARDHLSKGIAPSALLGCVQEEGNILYCCTAAKLYSCDDDDIGYRSTRANSDDLELPVFRSESALRHSTSSRTASLLHSDNESTASSAVVVMRIRRKPKSPLLAARMVPTQDDDRMTWSDSSDEGYVDEEKPMDSASLFLPLSDHEQHHLQDNEMLRVTAAIKIQAVWRGYHFRQQMKHNTSSGSGLKPSHRLMMDIVKLCGGVHKRQMTRMRQRLDTLEMHLEEETAMRIAFEKAMEDMTVMIDEQHKALYDRIEQEASMRQYYERKMDDTLGRIKPLERQLRQEARDRTELESMMTCVLEQMQDMKREAKAESDARRRLQAELDAARDEIARLKRPNSTAMAERPRSSMMVSTTQQQQRQGLLRAGDTRSVSAMANKTSMTTTTTTLRRPTTASTLSTKKTTTTTTLGTPQRGSSRMEMNKSIIPSTPSLLSRKR